MENDKILYIHLEYNVSSTVNVKSLFHCRFDLWDHFYYEKLIKQKTIWVSFFFDERIIKLQYESPIIK